MTAAADTDQVRALRALEALIAEHEVADAGTECQACPGQTYPCQTRTECEDAAERLRHRMISPRQQVSGQPKHIGSQ
jgi:hypothetical protein